MPSAMEVARYLLQLAAQEPEPELVSPQRLQNLLYYVQGWSLGVRGEPMFPEPIQAWRQGPVIPKVHSCFADCGSGPIPLPTTSPQFSDEDRAFIDSIWSGYKIHSAARLREMTHSEPPWTIAFGACSPGQACGGEVTHEAMLRYFARLMEDSAPPGLDLQSLREAEAEIASNGGITLEDFVAELA
jgi:uncharacterized phage-associated protein